MTRPAPLSPAFVAEAVKLHPDIVAELLASTGFQSLDMLSVYEQDAAPRGVRPEIEIVHLQSDRAAEASGADAPAQQL